MHKLIVKPAAELDATHAANWYNEKRKGLGDEFLLALEAKISEIQRNPTHFQIVYNRIQRALTERFPYGIFFITEEDTIYILAVQHTRKNPKVWKQRK